MSTSGLAMVHEFMLLIIAVAQIIKAIWPKGLRR
jgi:hypothetical protein